VVEPGFVELNLLVDDAGIDGLMPTHVVVYLMQNTVSAGGIRYPLPMAEVAGRNARLRRSTAVKEPLPYCPGEAPAQQKSGQVEVRLPSRLGSGWMWLVHCWMR
jgi:hypothetical protein